MSEYEWLTKLKTGDTVLVKQYGALSLATVGKITATQIVVGYSRYNIKNGSERGANVTDGRDLIAATEENMNNGADKARRSLLGSTKWNAEYLTYETILAIYNIVQDAKAAPK